jgi:hypothetical protein
MPEAVFRLAPIGRHASPAAWDGDGAKIRRIIAKIGSHAPSQSRQSKPFYGACAKDAQGT